MKEFKEDLRRIAQDWRKAHWESKELEFTLEEIEGMAEILEVVEELLKSGDAGEMGYNDIDGDDMKGIREGLWKLYNISAGWNGKAI